MIAEMTDTEVETGFEPESSDILPAPWIRLFDSLGTDEDGLRRLVDGLDARFPPRPRRSETALAAVHRMARLEELTWLYHAWISKEVTLSYVQLTADLTDEECDTLYRGRDSAMRIDRFGKVTYDEPTLIRAVCAVVGD